MPKLIVFLDFEEHMNKTMIFTAISHSLNLLRHFVIIGCVILSLYLW